ncbi:MAG: SAM-dependent chlorinase/fluorinase [Acidimicrobiia bacterium]|nr:SAM-dependent chlorinase/fluorinase [Acidimicrobiia bacterium]MYB25795.1 SAM-dependent chlorinase/fluorinase [Acidimicrobiia bacterium]MYE67620.1 SAM-dependent chlorinase/fluorinase [Acidimicrobiia bacterium]
MDSSSPATFRLSGSASPTGSTRPTWTPTWRTATPEPSELLRYRTVSFLSDYGLTDEFVGVVKSVIWSVAPEVRILDITHEVARYDVRGGGLTLARAAQYLNPGVVVAVVDPTVGTDRRPVAVEVGGGSSVLVGPDNGLLAPAVSLVGGATRAVELRNEQYRLSQQANTFDGRDVFGPAAGHLAAGVPLTELGPLIDPASLVPGIVANAAVHPDRVEAEVLWVDRFGNAQLNVGPEDLANLGDSVALRTAEGTRTAHRAETYAAVAAGETGLVVDSYGLVSLAQDRRNCAAELSLEAGSAVTLSRPDTAEDPAAAPSADSAAGAHGGGGTVTVRLAGRKVGGK